MKQATNPDDFALQMRGISSDTSSGMWASDFKPTKRKQVTGGPDTANIQEEEFLDLEDLKIEKF
jgi:hypothetical protein